jgi:perosamine synthetase
VRVQRRTDFIRKLASRAVPASVVHQRIDRHPLFGGRRDDLPGMDLFDAEQVALPVHERLTGDDLGQVISAIRSGW